MKTLFKILLLFSLLLISVPVGAEIIIYDDFEYTVDRDTSDKSLFTTKGTPNQWTGIKSRPYNTGAAGFTYTTTSIPGFSGSFPGTNSSRVLVSEHLPITYGVEQSDTYLSIWQSETPLFPSEIYIQFWVYLQYYGEQLSTFQSGKFLYPCADASGGSTCSTGHASWLTIFRQAFAGVSLEGNVASEAGHMYLWIDTQGAASYACPGCEAGNYWKLGVNQVNAATAQFQPNTWYLIKIHWKESAATSTYRMWRRSVAESEFTLLTEYITGSTSNLTWTPYSTSGTYGLNLMEMNYADAWFYMDDFIIATSEGDLPTYTPNPIITNITSSKTNGRYGLAEEIAITATFSEAVTSTGNVTATFETGDTDRTCTFTLTSETSGGCTYTVQAGDTSADLDVILSGTIVADATSLPMTNFTPTVGLAANKALVIDTAIPTLSDVIPTGQLNCATDPGDKILYVTTNENANCRHHATSTTWAEMAAMDSTGTTAHSTTVNYACDAAYTRKVVCQDLSDPINESVASTWSFSIAALAASEKSMTIGGGSQTITVGGGSQTISW